MCQVSDHSHRHFYCNGSDRYKGNDPEYDTRAGCHCAHNTYCSGSKFWIQGFGFKNYGSNVGVGIKLKKIAKKGDIIETSDIKGEIVDINNLSCTIKTDKGKIVVSNAVLANAKVVKKNNNINNFLKSFFIF